MMKLEPIKDWIIGYALITRKPGVIVAPDAAKSSTRCYLIERAGPDAEAAGYKPGDIVIAQHVYDMLLMAGTYHRVTFKPDMIISRVHGISPSEFLDIRGRPFEEPESIISTVS